MTEPQKLQVFLCYSSADREKVRALYVYLREHGISPWLDTENLAPGQDWQLEIAQAIRASDVIVVCLSKNSITKAGFVQKEIAFALDKAQEEPEGSIFMIPAKLEKCNVPVRLSRYQWVDLQQENGYQQLMTGLELRAKQRSLAIVESAPIEVNPLSFWPQKAVTLINKQTKDWSVSKWIQLFYWVLIWLLTINIISPSFHWPFADQQQALLALVMYAFGSLVLPLLIGMRTHTSNHPLWQARPAAENLIVRLYTHQGASVGFHVGYFIIFAFNIILYYAGFYLGVPASSVLQRLLDAIESLALMVCAYAAARLVPDNLWRAYGHLKLTDGAIFFVFVGLGPLWGFGFYMFYPFFLDPILGLAMLLAAAGLALGAMAWQQKKTGTTIIPAHWYTIFYGSLVSLYLLSIDENLFNVVAFEGLILTFGCLMAFERIHLTLRGLIGFLVIAGLLSTLLLDNLWLGRSALVVALLIWWVWDRKYLSFPPSFWGVIGALAGCLVMLQQEWISDVSAAIVFGLITLFLLRWEWRLRTASKV